MWNKLLFIVLIGFSSIAVADNTMQTFDQTAEKCLTLSCVRSNIDTLNSQIVILLGQRLAYVKRAGELKSNDTPVHDATREKNILDKVSAQAQQIGYPVNIVRAVFKEILVQANWYEEKNHR